MILTFFEIFTMVFTFFSKFSNSGSVGYDNFVNVLMHILSSQVKPYILYFHYWLVSTYLVYIVCTLFLPCFTVIFILVYGSQWRCPLPVIFK